MTGPDTRERLLDVAERLFAEHGLATVSHRRIAEEAGQANNSAVGYHVGARRELVVAVVARHVGPMDRRRAGLRAAGSPDVRDHVAALVLPVTEHLASLGAPSWYARFAAHAITDPSLREAVIGAAMDTASIRQVLADLVDCLPDLPPAVSALRASMARHLVVHTCAEAERALAQEDLDPTSVTIRWGTVGAALVDALVGLLTAPVEDRGRAARWAILGSNQ